MQLQVLGKEKVGVVTCSQSGGDHQWWSSTPLTVRPSMRAWHSLSVSLLLRNDSNTRISATVAAVRACDKNPIEIFFSHKNRKYDRKKSDFHKLLGAGMPHESTMPSHRVSWHWRTRDLYFKSERRYYVEWRVTCLFIKCDRVLISSNNIRPIYVAQDPICAFHLNVSLLVAWAVSAVNYWRTLKASSKLMLRNVGDKC